MGATVTTGRSAGAFRAPSGAIIYVLFEKTYEKNCHPHTPDWCCVGIGEIRDVMCRVFEIAAGCEGGMLQNSSGRITPESYLRSWFKELSNPHLMPDVGHELFLGTGFYDTVQKEKFAKARTALEEIGRKDIADRLENGERIPARLYEDTELIMALYGTAEKVLPPWLFFSYWPVWNDADRQPELGFKPSNDSASTSRFEIPLVRAVGEERLIQQPDGSFQTAGWTYSIVEDFIENLWVEGLRSPKACYQRIGAYREAVTNAPQVDVETAKVVVETAHPLDDEWGHRSIAAFMERFPVTKTETGFEVTPTKENVDQLTRLPRLSTRWLITAAQPAFALAG